jgi:DNA polymerase III subunit delta
MMTCDQILTDLQNKIYKPVYFLMGEEPYYIDVITDYILAHVLTDAEKAFNQSVFYGKDVDVAAVIMAARRFPMMANYQVIVVKEAQNVRGLGKSKEEDIEEVVKKEKNPEELLLNYVENPLKSTILVFDYKYKNLDKRKKLYKALEKNGVLYQSKRLYDNEIPKWINGYLADRKYTIDPAASQMLSDFLGVDLGKIVNEIEKLLITLPEGKKKITPDHVERNIGISKDYNSFELCKAVGLKDVLKANRIINYYTKNQKEHHILAAISALALYFMKLLIVHFAGKKDNNELAGMIGVHPFFVKEYRDAVRIYSYEKVTRVTSVLREYEMKCKGVESGTESPEVYFKEMIYKIIH